MANQTLLNDYTRRSSLREYLRKTFGIQIITVPKDIIKKAEQSKELQELEKQRTKKTAFHDILACIYVREERHGYIQWAQKVNIWFMSANESLFEFNRRTNQAKGVPEIILPDELVCLLWLKNPNKNASLVAYVGLKEIIAKIVTADIPEYKLLSELDDNIKKYSDFTEQQYALLVESLAYTSVKEINRINNYANESHEQFNKEIKVIIQNNLDEKAKNVKELQQIKEESVVVKNERQYLIERLNELENKLIKIPDMITNQTEKLKIKYKILKYLSITFGAGLLTLILYIFLPQTLDWIKNIIANIPTLGGLWGFINLIINIVKSIRKKKE